MLPTMEETTQSPTEPSNSHAGLVVGVLAIAHVLVNLFFNPIGTPVTGATEWLMKVLIGVVVAQPVLYAAWALIGPGRLLPRLLLTIVAFAAVLFSEFYRGFNRFDKVGPSNWESAMFLMFPLALFVICATAMTLVRKLTGWRIVSRTGDANSSPSARQFNMKFLLGFTALCAVLLGAGRIATSSDWLGERRAEFIGHMLAGVGGILLAVFPAFLVPLLALSKRAPWHVIVSLPFLWIGLTLLSVEAIVAIEPTEVRSQVLIDIVQVQLGAAATGLISALALRWAGYRLVTVPRASSHSVVE
jgi:hypothetical protein